MLFSGGTIEHFFKGKTYGKTTVVISNMREPEKEFEEWLSPITTRAGHVRVTGFQAAHFQKGSTAPPLFAETWVTGATLKPIITQFVRHLQNLDVVLASDDDNKAHVLVLHR